MKVKIKKYIKEFLFLIIFVAVFANILSFYRAQALNKNKLPFNTVILLNNTTYSLPKDKAILVHFWATWCPTCKLEASTIEKLSKHYEVLTVAVQSGSDAKIQAYMKEHHLSFNVINDDNASLATSFNISVFPTTLIYNRQKELSFSEVGYTSMMGLYLRMFLSQ